MLSGCSESHVSCSADGVKRLVEAITYPMIKEKFIANRLNEKSMGRGTSYMLMKHYGFDPEKIEGYKETKSEADDEFARYTSKLHNIRTTNEEDGNSKVECAGTVSIALQPYEPITYDVEYIAQIGSGEEKIYVEINALN